MVDLNEVIAALEADDVEHYGVKGMKWGVRKQRPSSGRKRPSSGPRAKTGSQSNAPKAKPKKKSVKSMTDEEIRKKIQRLELEKRLRDLTPDDRSRGKRIISRIGDKVMNNAIDTVGNNAGKLIGNLVFKGMTSAIPGKAGEMVRAAAKVGEKKKD